MNPKKYNKVSRDSYEQWYRENESLRRQVQTDPDRLQYHLMPETGWLNDPNGLCQIGGRYHIYYQYTPFEPTGEIKLWGHFTTEDFIHYEDNGPVLFPDGDIDAHGVYSGSAWMEDEKVHYFYTGNVKYFDRPNYDYILSGRGSNTIHVTSRDGYHFSQKRLVLSNPDYPKDVGCHVRDPKIIKADGYYYMALGARTVYDQGIVLLYRSCDLSSWKYHGRITTPEPFGYMWECPDLFLLDGQLCLVCCPQGVKKQGIEYENVHQCVFMKLSPDVFTKEISFPEKGLLPSLDRGFDFYAPQTFEDETGRRILIGWMGIPDAPYTNPTVSAGWQHALTLPRQLSLKDGRLIQTPLEELKKLRKKTWYYPQADDIEQAAEASLVWEAEITFASCKNMIFWLRDGVRLIYNGSLLTLELKKGGFGRGDRSVYISSLKTMRIYSDTTSLEIFINGGEEVFTTRVYAKDSLIKLKGDCEASAVLHSLSSFKINYPALSVFPN